MDRAPRQRDHETSRHSQRHDGLAPTVRRDHPAGSRAGRLDRQNRLAGTSSPLTSYSGIACAMRDRRAGGPTPRETALYLPVKRFLEKLGFAVKGEICGCDIVALRGEEPPVVVVCELKLAFNLELLLQGVNRTAACDEVWLAVRMRA